MDLFTLILLAIGLSMDAFAVSICKVSQLRKSHSAICLLLVRGLAVFRQ